MYYKKNNNVNIKKKRLISLLGVFSLSLPLSLSLSARQPCGQAHRSEPECRSFPWHLDCNLVRGSEPQLLSQVAPGLLTHRNSHSLVY